MGLKKILADSLSEKELGLLVRGYDLVGDIAVIIIPEELQPKQRLIAQAIFQINKRAKVVAKRAGNYGGEFRTIPIEVIAGEDRKVTIHRENDIRLQVNLEEVYYSTRSGNERKRVAGLVMPGELVLVMFSGIAPFPLVISKLSDAKKVIGVEKNPLAHQYGCKNLQLNRKLKNIFLYQGDVMEVLPEIGGSYDRIIMPLPKNGDQYLPCALRFLKSGGWLHFYDFQEKDNYRITREKVLRCCRKSYRKVIKNSLHECGHVAPRVQRICVDALIE